MDIVVLAGGFSTERDVSFVSGRMVYQALKKNGHRAILLDVFLGYEGNTEHIFEQDNDWAQAIRQISQDSPDLSQVKAMRTDGSDSIIGPQILKICSQADLVFIALHGANGEDGRLQALFDLQGIRYTGTGYFSSALAMDKGIARLLFQSRGIPTPDGYVLHKDGKQVMPEEKGVSYPCVVKPCCGGSSVGVSMVHDADEYKKALDEAFFYEDEVVVEKYISGREFSVGVIDGKALPIIEIAPVSGFYDYKNKYQAGSTVETCPAVLDEELTLLMQHYAQKVCRVLKIRTYARIDFMLDAAQEMFCLEANTLPGMTPTSLLPQEAAVVGYSFEQLCEKLVESSLAKY